MANDQEQKNEGRERQQDFKADPRVFLQVASRLHMAGMSTSAKYWMEWAQYVASTATRYANYPQWIYSNPGRAGEWYGRLMDDSREYMRMMTELPTRAARDYSLQVEEIMRDVWPAGAGNRPMAADTPDDEPSGSAPGGAGASDDEPGGPSPGGAGGYGNSKVRRAHIKD